MNLDQRLIKQASQNRWLLFTTICFGFAAGLFTILQAGAISRVVAGVYLKDWRLQEASYYLGLLLLVFALRASLVWGSEMVAHHLARRVKTSLRAQLYERFLVLGPSFSRNESTGELIGTMLEGVEALDAYYSQYLPQLALAALVPLTFLLVIFPIDWISGLILLLTAPLIPLFMVLIGNMAQSLTRRQWNSLSRMKAYFLDILQGLSTLKAFGQSRAQVKQVADISEKYRQVTMQVLRVTFLSALALELVATLSTAVLAVQVGLRLLYGRMEFEQAFFLLLLAPEFYLPLRLLGTRFHAGMAGVQAAQSIFSLLQENDDTASQIKHSGDVNNGLPSPRSLSDDAHSASPAITQPPSLRFDKVSFSYGDGRDALEEITLKIPAGEKVALVGPSGSGKSSLANLILKFIEPQHGTIWIDEIPHQCLEANTWRNKVAWVSQQPYLFHSSIAENIRLAKPGASMEEITQAARLAHADEFIRRFPNGYDTLVAEGSANLSAGQAQRIALARAFLKDALLVILDEATANLDPETESLIQDSINQLLKDRTALIIAHRLNTIIHADQILVLDRGRLIQQGTHSELAARPGKYRDLVAVYSELHPGSNLPNTNNSSKQSHDQLDASLSAPDPQTYQLFIDADAPDSSAPALQEQTMTAPISETKGVIRRLLALVTPFKFSIALSALTGMATSLSGIGLLGTSAYLISAAAQQPSIAELQVAIVGVRFFGIARGVFRYLERLISHDVTFKVLGRLRVSFYQALEPLAPARLQRYRSGDLLERISGDIESLENFYVRTLAPPLVALGIGFVSYLLLVFLSGRPPALGFILVYLLAGVGVPLIARSLSRHPGRQLAAQRALLSSTLVDGIQGISDLLVNNAAGRQARLLSVIQDRLSETQQRLKRISSLQDAMLGFLTNLGVWVVLVLSILQITSGEMQGVLLAVVTLIALSSFEAVQPLPLAAQTLEGNIQAARRLFQILDAAPEVQDPIQALPLPARLDLSVRELTFDYPGVISWPGNDFAKVLPGQGNLLLPKSYPSKTEEFISSLQAIRGITFDLKQGKKIALVGASGAGKSTLIALLMRYWEYRSGFITLGGQDIRQFCPDDLRTLMAVVAQNAYLFRATIRDNLRLARPQATQEEMEQAARSAQILDFIQSLPAGFETWIGEQGLTISAGQRQRLAIARAVLKNAPIFLLDEPTSNLDSMTEQALIKTLQPLMQDRSVLWITHRLTGMQWMDEILVLRRGEIVERGRHQDLLDKQGYYWKMVALQNQELTLQQAHE